MSPARRNDSIVIAVGLVWIVLDQLVKHWITSYFTTNGRLYSSIPLLGNTLEIIYEQNSGVAFSLLEGQAGLYILIVVAICVIGWLYWRTRDASSLWLKVTFGLIIGGATGNLIDRLRLGYVVDFIHFQLPAIHFNFAVFNVADAGISVGVVLLIIQLLFGNRSGGVLSPVTAKEQASSSSPTPNTTNVTTATEIAVPTEPKVRRRVASGRQ